jgi:hypothetical protein
VPVSLFLGFVGGVLAVAFKGWIDYALERRRETRVVRASLRLLLDAAQNTRVFAEGVMRRGEWWMGSGHDFVSIWADHQAVLASGLSDVDWLLAQGVAVRMENVGLRAERSVAIDECAVTDEDRTWLEEQISEFSGAQSLLYGPRSTPRRGVFG